MTSIPDPYKVLGVSKDAQLAEIRSAHRKLVLRCHPDKVQDPTLKAAKQDEFQKVQQAYELLSDDSERAKYDDNVKLAELRLQMKNMSANTSAPRSQRMDIHIRTASPRADTFRTTTTTTTPARPSPGAKLYSQQNSRSWDEDIARSSPSYEPRRTTSYEKPSRQDEERERERADRERRRRKEEERERERDEVLRERKERKDREQRIALEREKQEKERKVAEKAAKRAAEEKEREREARRAVRKAQEKAEREREKERKQQIEEKLHRHNRPAYVEHYGDDDIFVKSDKKKSSSTKEKEKEKRSRSIPRELREDAEAPPVPSVDPTRMKIHENMNYAASYMTKSRKIPGLTRAATYNEGTRLEPPAAPTPPPASAAYVAPPPPPVPSAEEDSRRSKSRRSSETKVRDKSSHKKSSPAKEPPLYNVVQASPTTRNPPQFVSAHSSPTGASPPKISRAATMEAYSRPVPGISRSQTMHGYMPESRGRHRSRLPSDDSESEDDRRPPVRSYPQPAVAEYVQPRTHTYNVTGGRAVPVEPPRHSQSAYYREQEPPRDRHYERPSMGPRESSYSSTAFGKVKTSRGYTAEDVSYSNIPHNDNSYRYRDPPAYAY